jgi:predicted nucleotidyltransferase
MQLSAPVEAVVPSLDGVVLVALAKLAMPVTGRQVHRLIATGSEGGVRRVLNRLVQQGVVHGRPAGGAVLYSANRQHLAWPAVEVLAGLRGELLRRLRHELGSWPAPPRSAALFGSAARGDGDSDSDIDLLLVRDPRTDPDDEWQTRVAQLRDDVLSWTGNRCQVYDIASDDLQRQIDAHDSIVRSWHADAVTVCGTDLRGLLRTLGHQAAA